jgi:hypothetical protein
MNSSLRFSVEGEILKIQLEGSYTMDSFIDLVGKAFQSPDTPEKVAILIDRRHSSVETTSSQDLLRGLEDLFAWKRRTLCLAYVTLSDYYFDFMQRASSYAKFNNFPPVEPFRDIEQAENWIRKQTGD